MRRSLIFAIALIAAPAAAQEIPESAAPPAPTAPPTTPAPDVATGPDGRPIGDAFEGDFLVVGVGVLSMPDYEGSDDRSIRPGGGVYGRLGGVEINPRSAGVALDFVPDPKGGRIGFSLGPVARYRSNRSGSVDDPAVEALGERDALFEAGVALGVTFKKLLNDYDRLSLSTDVRWDISGKGAGRVISPGVSYFTPVSRGQVIGARVGLEFVDSKYANYNYAISPAESAASGLPEYVGRGGLKEWNIGAFTAVDLSGDFTNGGFALGAGAFYSRLQESAAETPLTSIRGERGQWFFGAGLGYTF